jgi:hypothetical protein
MRIHVGNISNGMTVPFSLDRYVSVPTEKGFTPKPEVFYAQHDRTRQFELTFYLLHSKLCVSV